MILIQNALIINENKIIKGSVLIENDLIEHVFQDQENIPASVLEKSKIIHADGLYLMPGVIDDQVHFREPGLTHKGNIATESKAAIAGGITSFMEMPNTIPNALTQKLLEEKYEIAAQHSYANYSFFMGVSNDNYEEVLKTDPKTVCGLKIFMGSSTGNMLVDNETTLEKIFASTNILIATHCEDEQTIQNNVQVYKQKYGNALNATHHPLIRSEEACYKSSSKAVALAKKYDSRLHVLHISTAKELSLFSNERELKDKRITSEACIHHLCFSDQDYAKKGNWIKWNPAIKTMNDQEMLWKAIENNIIDVIATDHAPHTIDEKNKPYLDSPSGGPLVQHALPAMLNQHQKGKISLEKIVEKMCHHPAICFQIKKRGFIKKGYKADIVLFSLDQSQTVSTENILYKCKWSPFINQIFHNAITHTFINGHLAYEHGHFFEHTKKERLVFER